MLERLRSQLDADRLIDAEVFCIDGTDIRDGRAIDPVMGAVQLTGRRERPTCRPVKPAGDKDCSYPRIWRWLARHGVLAGIQGRAIAP